MSTQEDSSSGFGSGRFNLMVFPGPYCPGGYKKNPKRPYIFNRKQTIKAEGIGKTDRSFIAHVELTAAEAAAADADGIIVITMGTAKKTVSEGFNPMPAARNLTVVGSAAGISGNVIVTGKNMAGETISETFALAGTDQKTGSKAFASISSVEVPARNAAGDAVQVGWGVKFGIPYKLGLNTVLAAYVNGAKEGSFTVTVSAEALESNTIQMNTTPAGKAVDYFLIV